MQVFRFMDSPDRVLAFDSLPERLVLGFELCRADGFPRHWKNWMGKVKLYTKIPPEKDFLTGSIRTFPPIVEEDSFFYLVDATLNNHVEKWKDVTDFVRANVSKDIRLTERLEDMSKPLAANKTDSVSLDPEDVTVIPIPLEFQEKEPVASMPTIIDPPRPPVEKKFLNCDEPGCDYQAEGTYAKNSIRFHKQKKHPKQVAVAAAVAAI